MKIILTGILCFLSGELSSILEIILVCFIFFVILHAGVMAFLTLQQLIHSGGLLPNKY